MVVCRPQRLHMIVLHGASDRIENNMPLRATIIHTLSVAMTVPPPPLPVLARNGMAVWPGASWLTLTLETVTAVTAWFTSTTAVSAGSGVQ